MKIQHLHNAINTFYNLTLIIGTKSLSYVQAKQSGVLPFNDYFVKKLVFNSDIYISDFENLVQQIQ